MLYDDGLIACDETRLVVRRYYLWSDKPIAHSAITAVEQRALTGLRGGSWRIWGSTDFTHEYNLDRTHPAKRVAIEIHTRARTMPVISPDDPGSVYAILVEKIGVGHS